MDRLKLNECQKTLDNEISVYRRKGGFNMTPKESIVDIHIRTFKAMRPKDGKEMIGQAYYQVFNSMEYYSEFNNRYPFDDATTQLLTMLPMVAEDKLENVFLATGVYNRN